MKICNRRIGFGMNVTFTLQSHETSTRESCMTMARLLRSCLINRFFKFSPALYINCQYDRVPLVLIGSRNIKVFFCFLDRRRRIEEILSTKVSILLSISFFLCYCCPGINFVFNLCEEWGSYVVLIASVVITIIIVYSSK